MAGLVARSGWDMAKCAALIALWWQGAAPALAAGDRLESCARQLVAYDGEDLPAEDTIQLQVGAARLHLLGAQHSRDPDDPQHARIASEYETFRPDVAFYEGPDRGVRADREQTIAETGESGLVRFLAGQHGAAIRGLEPDPREEFLFILEAYPIDQAVLFYLLRSAAQWREREGLSSQDIDGRMAAFLERVNGLLASLPAPHADYRVESTAQIDAMADRYWPGRDWREAPMDWFTPERRDEDTGGVFTNGVNMRSSDFRNLGMYRAVAGELVAGRDVFGVVGGDHLPRLRPAFECLAGEERA